jgi:hypothetical protein
VALVEMAPMVLAAMRAADREAVEVITPLLEHQEHQVKVTLEVQVLLQVLISVEVVAVALAGLVLMDQGLRQETAELVFLHQYQGYLSLILAVAVAEHMAAAR